MISLGMLIGERYEILEKIGTGGMSDVYKAKDQKLNRYVGIKILKQEFSENKNFVSKFRVEAQAAAGLMHPNIVNVYDVGEENGIHYIVMELVEGITLKKYIEKKVRLSAKEAISIAIQVAMGIEAAHNNHIIHRDIKPQNIMISKEGKVKVTDFGIAKAATSNTITSNVMGSVHYTSPEQARGGFSDEKSDIYSLGITMFEMLTGRVPFTGDTTVSIAIKHIQDNMPSPREFASDIPVSVEGIVLKCTQKNPDRRYQCVSDIIRDLKRSLINPDENFIQNDSVDEGGKTRIVPETRQRSAVSVLSENIHTGNMANISKTERPPARREMYAEDEELNNIPVKRTQTGKVNVNMTAGNTANMKPIRKTGTNSSTPIRTTVKTANSGKNTVSSKNEKGQNRNVKKSGKNQSIYYDENYKQNNTDEKDYDYNPTTERITTVFTVLSAIIIGCIVLYFVGQAAGIFSNTEASPNNDSTVQTEAGRAIMPEFVGFNADEIKELLNKNNLGVRISYEESTEYDKNQVISAALEDGQEVLAGDQILLNTTIVLKVSAGSDGVKVPEVLGYSEAEGTAKLKQESFVVNKTDKYSADYAKGTIIEQSLEGGSIAALGSEITIVISKGNEDVTVRMPEVLGKSQEAAISTLEATGLVVGNIEESYSSEYPQGQICYQSYSVGASINQGTTVDLKISIGTEVATYRCNISVQAPADYTGGNAEVILTTADGTEQLWYNQNVTSFPVSINLNGFTSSSAYGVVTITYLKNVEEMVTDSDGNQFTQVNQALAQIQQNVEFIKE